uniref:NADH-ubiquinone oxidoreductase chain 6 n=1 Tax=Sanfilippodytes adelardi TaxID=2714631 RepID=A0A894K626_9DYTI|nr:NADH dehydrogenase subunit 6 [Sanfilippodytes adelardi]
MYLIIMNLNLILTLMFLFMNHPMSMGLILMFQSIIITMLSGMFSYSFWFSYILFLIMIGGMLILFMYMTSLASNEKFKFSKSLLIIIPFMLISMFITLMINDPLISSYLQKNSNMLEMINNLNIYKNENLFSMNMMYNNPNYLITILMINYLLLTLIAAVKITKSNTGPLRQKF